MSIYGDCLHEKTCFPITQISHSGLCKHGYRSLKGTLSVYFPYKDKLELFCFGLRASAQLVDASCCRLCLCCRVFE